MSTVAARIKWSQDSRAIISSDISEDEMIARLQKLNFQISHPEIPSSDIGGDQLPDIAVGIPPALTFHQYLDLGSRDKIYFKIVDPTWVANNPDVPPIFDVPGLNIGDRGQGWEVAEGAPPGSPPVYNPHADPKSSWQLPDNIPEDLSLQQIDEVDSANLLNKEDRARLVMEKEMITTSTTTPGPDAGGIIGDYDPYSPGDNVGLDAPPGWWWDEKSGSWRMPMEGAYSPTPAGRVGPNPAFGPGGWDKKVRHPGIRWRWIPAERIRLPGLPDLQEKEEKEGKIWIRPGYWEERPYGGQRPWRRGEKEADEASFRKRPVPHNIDPADIPGFAPDVPFPTPFDPNVNPWKGIPGGFEGAAGGAGAPPPPGGEGPRIPLPIQIGPNDKIDPSLGRPLTDDEKLDAYDAFERGGIEIPESLKEFMERFTLEGKAKMDRARARRQQEMRELRDLEAPAG